MTELRRLFATLLQLVRLRVDLVSVELDEQIACALNLLWWYIVAILCVMLCAVFLAVTIIIACWDQHRLLAAGGVTTGFGILGLIGVAIVRTRRRERPKILAATLGELKRDAESMRGDD
jgi:uncharacterized membrane protein YqjE